MKIVGLPRWFGGSSWILMCFSAWGHWWWKGRFVSDRRWTRRGEGRGSVGVAGWLLAFLSGRKLLVIKVASGRGCFGWWWSCLQVVAKHTWIFFRIDGHFYKFYHSVSNLTCYLSIYSKAYICQGGYGSLSRVGLLSEKLICLRLWYGAFLG